MLLQSQIPQLSKKAFINQGGVGEVFGDPRNPGLCIKRFFKPLRGEEAAGLLRLVTVAESARPSDREILTSRFSWPIECFGTPNELLGYSMPLASRDAFFDLTVAGRTNSQLLQFKFLLDRQYWESKAVTSPAPAMNTDDRIQLLVDVAESIQLVHQFGLVYGDISGNNICALRGSLPTVFLLDADSITTPEHRLAHQVKTVDWNAPDGLDPESVDRSLVALLAWRLFQGVATSYPSESDFSFHPAVSQQTIKAISSTFRSGSKTDFSQLLTSLRKDRTKERSMLVISRAEKSGFARSLLVEIEHVSSSGLETLRHAALRHQELEVKIENASEVRQSLLIDQYASESRKFKLDILPTYIDPRPPSSSEQLQKLILDARFLQIAKFFAAGDVAVFETNSWTQRAVEHGLETVALPELQASANYDGAIIDWTWPDESFVNGVEISVSAGNGQKTKELVLRSQNSKNSQRNIRAAGGVSLEIGVRYVVVSPTGTRCIHSKDAVTSTSIPVRPTPQPVSLKPSGLSVATSPIAIYDPVEEERLRLVEVKRCRRKKRKIILLVVASVLAIAGGVTAFYKTRSSPPKVVLIERIGPLFAVEKTLGPNVPTTKRLILECEISVLYPGGRITLPPQDVIWVDRIPTCNSENSLENKNEGK